MQNTNKNTRQPLSVTIVALNAAHQITACLESVAFADEIVVVDSGSTDATLEIARKHGARVIHQDWLGFGPQKQFAVTQASYDWVLCLDCDERISEGLRQSIEAALVNPEYQAYQMPRCNRFMGRWLRHGEGYPDWSLRLFNRHVAGWSEDAVHEKVITATTVCRLKGDLLHESAESLDTYLEKQNRYTTLQAQKMADLGKLASLVQLIFSPVLRFIKFYFVRLGFLDGLPGLVHISIGCFNSFIKYAKLKALSRKDEG
nr:glycosyltransferase family 2 protein [Sulfurirhabdus autotrophica]